MTTELGKIIDEILRRKNWVQEDLAQFIGVGQPTISKMRHSDEWDAHWQIFVKLLPLWQDESSARDLKHKSLAEDILNGLQHKKTRGTATTGTRKVKKGTVSHLPPRRHSGKSTTD